MSRSLYRTSYKLIFYKWVDLVAGSKYKGISHSFSHFRIPQFDVDVPQKRKTKPLIHVRRHVFANICNQLSQNGKSATTNQSCNSSSKCKIRKMQASTHRSTKFRQLKTHLLLFTHCKERCYWRAKLTDPSVTAPSTEGNMRSKNIRNPVSVVRLHAGDDSIVGRRFTVATVRRRKAFERLTGRILRERWDAIRHKHTKEVL